MWIKTDDSVFNLEEATRVFIASSAPSSVAADAVWQLGVTTSDGKHYLLTNIVGKATAEEVLRKIAKKLGATTITEILAEKEEVSDENVNPTSTTSRTRAYNS